MSVQVKLIPKKQLFINNITGYRIMSCIPVGVYPNLELNKYHNFTVSGSNIDGFKVNEECEVILHKDDKSKYPASYHMDYYAGIEINDKITISSEMEVNFLKQFMNEKQANYVHNAYPNFVQMIIDGKESEIDYHKIYNVGSIRLEDYIEGVKFRSESLKYFPICYKWGIVEDDQIKKLMNKYDSSEHFLEAMDDSPYDVFFNGLEFSFSKTDRAVLDKRPELKDSLERCKYGVMEILHQNEAEGDTRIDADLLVELAEELVPECKQHLQEAIETSDKIYYDKKTECTSIKSTYENEKLIAEELINRIKTPESIGMDWTKFTNVDGFECTEEQIKALQLINKNKAIMIRGHAGTGKTTVMKATVKMLEHYNKDYILLAPTGKAAARLRETTGRDASTIHMLLSQTKGGMIAPDFVVIDEMSMVGVNLLASLLKIITPETRLVFICDEAQLASISCGNIVQDIIDSGVMPQANLTKVFRYGSSGLATIATDTRNGKFGVRKDSEFDDYTFYEAENPLEQIVDVYSDMLDEGYTKDDILILCPYNKSSNGTYRINQEIQSRFNSHEPTEASREIKNECVINFRVGDKVINTKNNYNMPCFKDDDDEMQVPTETMFVANGDIGTVVFVKKKNDIVQIGVQFNDKIACVTKDDINHLLLGYAITIHKSQGSQSKVVIMYTNKMHERMISRNLLYVGDSRAQEKLIEIGNVETIKQGLKKQENEERDTWLKEMLSND